MRTTLKGDEPNLFELRKEEKDQQRMSHRDADLKDADKLLAEAKRKPRLKVTFKS